MCRPTDTQYCKLWRAGFFAGFLSFFAAQACLAAAPVTPSAHGRLSLKYLRDSGGGLEEQRLAQYFYINVSEIYQPNLSFFLDVKNENRRSNFDRGSGVKRAPALSVYSAYFLLGRLDSGFSMSAGRQGVYTLDSLSFDGFAGRWEKGRNLSVSGYAGSPLTYIGEQFGRRVEGLGTRLGSSRSVYLEFNWQRFINGGSFNPDETAQVSFYQSWGSLGNLNIKRSYLNGLGRDLSVRANILFPIEERRLNLEPFYFSQDLTTKDAELGSPYLQYLGSYEKSSRAGIRFSLSAYKWLFISGTGEVSLPDKGPGKRNSYSATLASYGLPLPSLKGLGFSLTASRNYYQSGSNSYLGGSLSYNPTRAFELSAGSSFSGSQSESVLPGSRTDMESRSYYATAKFVIKKNFELRVSPSMSRSAGGTFSRLEVRNSWRF